jgi:hypothetical protein
LFRPGPESLDVRLFKPDEIPHDEIAFPSVQWALKAWRDGASGPLGRPAGNPPYDKRDTNWMLASKAGFAVDTPP